MMNNNQSTSFGGTFLAFAIGALAGAGLALLYAPRSGKDTRELISRRTRELKEQANEALEDTAQAIRDKRDVLLSAVQAGRDAMREELKKEASRAA